MGSKWLQLMSLILMVLPHLLGLSVAQNCGTGGPCQSGLCCSKHGFCGTTDAYCGADCVSQCPAPSPPPPPPPPPSPPSTSGIGVIVTSSLYDRIFPNRNPSFTYQSFLSAAGTYPTIGTTGTVTQQKQEIAALLAHATHETSGLKNIREDTVETYCDWANTLYPCVAGQQYFGRGPLQLSWNYNYGQFGTAINQNLLATPDLVASDAILSWRSAMWFWTAPQAPKPSCESVMDGSWTPSSADVAAQRLPGFGLTINIINGGKECGPNAVSPGPMQAANRVAQYKSICDILGVGYGVNLDCTTMQPYG